MFSCFPLFSCWWCPCRFVSISHPFINLDHSEMENVTCRFLVGQTCRLVVMSFSTFRLLCLANVGWWHSMVPGWTWGVSVRRIGTKRTTTRTRRLFRKQQHFLRRFSRWFRFRFFTSFLLLATWEPTPFFHELTS